MLRKTYKNEIYQFSYAGDALLNGMINNHWSLGFLNISTIYGERMKPLINNNSWLGYSCIIIQVINDILEVHLSNIHLRLNDILLPINKLYEDTDILLYINPKELLPILIKTSNVYCDPCILDAIHRIYYGTDTILSGNTEIEFWDDSEYTADFPKICLSRCIVDNNISDIPSNLRFTEADNYGSYIQKLKTVDTHIKFINMQINFKLQLKKKFKVFILNNIKHLQNYYIN